MEIGKKQSDKQSGIIEKSFSVKHNGNLSWSKKSSSNVEKQESGKLGRKILISSEVSNTVEKIIWCKHPMWKWKYHQSQSRHPSWNVKLLISLTKSPLIFFSLIIINWEVDRLLYWKHYIFFFFLFGIYFLNTRGMLLWW